MEWLRRFFATLFGRRKTPTASAPLSFASPPSPEPETRSPGEATPEGAPGEVSEPEPPRDDAPPPSPGESPEPAGEEAPPEPEPAVEPEPQPEAEAESEAEPEPEPEPEGPAVVVLDFELDAEAPDVAGEALAALEEAEEDPDAPDPFISEAAPPVAPAVESSEGLAARRAEAMAQALVGEHRLFLTDAAGPGTLAEALNRLLDEGRVRADYIDDGETPPHILYAPVLYAPVAMGSEGSELHSDIEPS